MRACLANCVKRSKIIIGLFAVLIFPVLFFGCAKESNVDLVICNADDYSLYPKVVGQILPTFSIEQSENKPYYILDDGVITEAFDTQAVGALETGIAKYWYPHYLATVIIAVDRDQTDAVVAGWNDLLATPEDVAIFDTPGNAQMLTAAMSFGLEGKQYSLTRAIEMLASLHDNDRLKINSFASPIIICYDYQAASLIQNGRNIEIVVPTEGTFSYEKGLLSNGKLNFTGDIDKLLLEAKLRLLDGQSDFSGYPNQTAYPDEAAYAHAVRVDDYKHFAKATQKVSSLIERKVLNSKRFMSIDDWEHLHFALIYIIIVTIWAASVVRRSMQKGISYAAFFTGIILNGWTLVRLIKYQVETNQILIRYLWYSFYIFQLTLPLVMLWMAWAIDKPENETVPPKWWRNVAILISILIILVFTNDLHGLVFHLDLSRSDWGINYSYGLGYYTVFFVCMANLVAVFVILIYKSIKNPRKKAFVFPVVFFIMFIIYNYKYIMREPFVYETDITIVTGVFTMITFEACIRSGLIPVNTKYIDLFKRSPLKMQIINKEGEMVLASASAAPLNEDILDKVLASSPVPILQEDDSLLFANPIPGGYAVWNEDISKLCQLLREIQESTQMLTEANVMLSQEEKLKRFINEANAKKQLMEQLDAEIAESTEQLSAMIEELPHSENHSKETTGIALLLCYIKRRCNLFFREKETNTIAADVLISYMDELCEIARYSNVQIATANELDVNLTARHATLFYAFFYAVVDLAVQAGSPYIIENLGSEEEFITLRLLPSEDIGIFKPEPRLIAAIAAAKGNVVIKDLENTTGISISFPKEGVAHD